MQHWLVNGDVESPTGQIGLRWYEFQAPQLCAALTGLNIAQSGTYAGNPPDTNYRWMGSIARDKAYDILLGYSESNATTIFPSIATAGRVLSTPAGTLGPDTFVINGTNSQTASPWGGYSTMEIDPTDNCTFFFTTEYYQVTSSSNWSTDISKWKFPGC